MIEWHKQIQIWAKDILHYHNQGSKAIFITSSKAMWNFIIKSSFQEGLQPFQQNVIFEGSIRVEN